MKRILLTTAAAVACSGAAFAGGLDRSGQTLAFMFEKGNYAELSFGYVAPKVSGTAVPALGGFGSGDMAGDYMSFSLAYKAQLNDNLSLGIILDQPFGADVSYPGGTGYYAAASVAELDTMALTAVLKYTTDTNFSVYGGLRYQTMSASANVPFVASYVVSGERDGGLGYVVGVAYERPDIALRVALTYNSAITHKLDTRDASLLTGGAFVPSVTTVETPQSVNLEFQSGVAKDTLVFGSIRWVDWSSFVIDPAGYPPPTPLVSYANDTISYTLGVGRRFSEAWSAALTLGYEDPGGGFASNLGPTDGYASIGLGATYTHDNMKVSFGVRYVDIGNARTTLNNVSAAANFEDNSALGFGVKVGFTF